MENKSLCRRVSSMLSLYIDNQVTYQERAFIEDHLSNCHECNEKYVYLQSLIKELKSSYKMVLEAAKKKQAQQIFSIREHEKFLDRLYPYLDNELPAKDCIEFKDYLAKSQTAQRELKSIYKIQKELHLSYDRIKNSLNKDFSHKIAAELQGEKNTAVLGATKMFFSAKTVKIALLAGLVLFGGYELELLLRTHNKTPAENVLRQENIFSQLGTKIKSHIEITK